MSTSTVALTIEMPSLDASLSWNALESLVVGMSHEVPARALALALDDAQERLLQEAYGPRWAPVRGRLAPFACPGCGAREDFARKGKRTRPRKLHTAAGTVELILWHVGCRSCGRNFAPLLVILGLSGKWRTDRLSLDLAELGTQMSFARAGRVDAELAGTSATAGQAHNAMADVAALLTGGHEPEPDDDQPVADEPHEPDEPDADRPEDDQPEDDQPPVADADAADEPGDGQPGGDQPGDGQPGGDQPGGDQPGAAAAGGGGSIAGQSFTAKSGAGERLECRVVGVPVLGPGHLSPKVVMLDGTGGRAGDKTNGVPVNLAIGLTGRSGPVGRRRAHTHLLGLTVGEDWSMMGAQLQEVAAPAPPAAQGLLRRRRRQPPRQPSLGPHHGRRAGRAAARAVPRRGHHRAGPGRLGRLQRPDPGRPDQRPRLPGRRPPARLHLPGPRPPQGAGPPRRPRAGHRRHRTPHARAQRPYRHRRRPLDDRRATRPAHRPDRPGATTPRLDRNPQKHPAIEYNPVPPAEVQRNVTLPNCRASPPFQPHRLESLRV